MEETAEGIEEERQEVNKRLDFLSGPTAALAVLLGVSPQPSVSRVSLQRRMAAIPPYNNPSSHTTPSFFESALAELCVQETHLDTPFAVPLDSAPSIRLPGSARARKETVVRS